ncbi:ABC transporter substrate-binding protein [Bradyrhizobium huanghuaihaiense]|uniref:ABC transporter substrate-binding protein n=1 Tax=Bradyrhizobium huanghuaihaiense TaxID=990078 RepID=UPI0021AAC55D|nr:ABC transporter substrate-binding protein [Bradyrhizobium sp. CB3035]UWU81501.1 ABC transporter substrate-binding protein [Bradyrhizobium sp. CB3035]
MCLKVAACAAIASLALGSAVAADQVTVVSLGGAFQAAQRKAYFEPFSKDSGIKVIEDEYNGEISKIRAMVEAKSVSWDVVTTSALWTIEMCNQGIVEKIDWAKLGLDRSSFIGAEQYDCGVPDAVSATVLAYDRDKLPNGPKIIADLFDTQKFPGKRGLYKGPDVNLEWALIADGVAIGDVHKVLSTPEGVDRAFRKLDTIKKDVIWWSSGAQPVQLLADGQVIMTAAYNGRIYDAVKNSGKHFEIVWDAHTWSPTVWTIPKGTPRRDEAYKFIAFAASPRAQANLTLHIPYSPTNKEAMTFVDPAIVSQLPTAPEHVARSVIYDTKFKVEKGDELRQRFNAWLAK